MRVYNQIDEKHDENTFYQILPKKNCHVSHKKHENVHANLQKKINV